MITFILLLLLGLCDCVVVCEVVLVPYVDTVVAATVIRVRLVVLHVIMVRDCKGARVTAMLV